MLIFYLYRVNKEMNLKNINSLIGKVFLSLSLILPILMPSVASSERVKLYPLKDVVAYGYVNKLGEYIIKPLFDRASVFHNNGLAAVAMDGKSGYIDRSGQYIINQQFDEAYSFYDNGLAKVQINGRFGVINQTGAWILKPLFKDITILDELIKVDFGEYEGYADLNGKYLTFSETEVYNANF